MIVLFNKNISVLVDIFGSWGLLMQEYALIMQAPYHFSRQNITVFAHIFLVGLAGTVTVTKF